MWQEYYEKQLYPLQDSVLKCMDSIPTSFYLTGGTALSRAYLHHRYSDDLDFFVNYDDDFKQKTQLIISELQQQFQSLHIAIVYDSFARCFINQNGLQLKIEFVNDVPYRVGKPQPTSLFSQTDTIANILSNKLSALQRNEAKDLADIWQIALHYSFNWKKVIEDAQNKDMWVDESQVMIAIEQFDLQRLSEVNWSIPFDLAAATRDFAVIVEDLLFGRDNSLCV
ncbi:nucleotidyl transferase AbiEii/AbiGii toxin family protein [Rhodoflexus sp.]